MLARARSAVPTARWAWRAVTVVRSQPRSLSLTVPLAPPPPGPGRRVVRNVLRARRATCLTSALVLQAWDDAHGVVRDVVIGVTTEGGFRAHAWLDGGRDGAGFTEIARRRGAEADVWHRGAVADGSEIGAVSIPATVAFESVDGEGVLLDTDAGRYFRLNPVAARLWELLVANGGDVGGAIPTLLDEFDVERDVLVGDIDRLLAELAARGLVDRRDG